VNHQGVSLFLDGVLTGAGGFTKTGAGEVVLPSPNSYTGATTVAAGFLTIMDGRGPGFECRRDDRAEGSDPCSARGHQRDGAVDAHGCRRGSLRRL